MLCGIWVTGLIFLILEPKNRFVRFHAIQSIVTFGGLSILDALLWFAPKGWFFSAITATANIIFSLSAFVFWIVLMIKAYQGDYYKLSFAGDIAEQLAGKA